ncbi:MAG: histidine kinase [Deferribacterota bacterium]|nr:histidine kinase [Deferribacterota bacterium]
MQRRILIATLLFTLFISLSFGIVSYYLIINDINHLKVNQQNVSESITRCIDYNLENNIKKLFDISLTRIINFNNYNPNVVQKLLENAYRYSMFTESIFIVNRDCEIFESYPQNYANFSKLYYKPYVKRAVETDRFVISPLINKTNKNVVYTVVPLKNTKNESIGAIVGVISINRFELNIFIKNLNILKDNYIGLVDIKGNVLVSNKNYKRVKFNKNLDKIIETKKNRLSKVILLDQYGREKNIELAINPLGNAPWAVLFGSLSPTMFAPVVKVAWILLSIFLLYILTGIVFSVGLGRNITAPINDLILETKEISKGNYNKPLVVTGSDEVLELGKSFENMRIKLSKTLSYLENYNIELEKEVSKRTKEIEESKKIIEMLLKRVINSQENERNRIARELHDEILQDLSAILMHLDIYINKIDKDKNLDVYNNLQELRSLILRTFDNVKYIMQNLRPPLIDELGLKSSIEWLLQNTLKKSDIDYELKLKDIENLRLSHEYEINIFRIIQETITNIIKHAKAKNVSISMIKSSDGFLEVSIKDDGIGFDLEKMFSDLRKDTGSLRGIGILGMMERAGIIDGMLDINSKEGEGTEITLRIKLEG